MDKKLRILLNCAEQKQDVSALDDAFEQLRLADSRLSMNSTELFSHDLYVLCAETAIKLSKYQIARDSLKMFFSKIAPQNQFLGRAYLAQAQLLAPDTAENPEQLEKAVVFLLRAVKFAKDNPRGLIECLLEANKYKEAIDVSTNAASFTKKHCPPLYREVFRLQVLHELVELPILYRASRSSGDLNCFYRIQKIKAKLLRNESMQDPRGRISKVLDQIMNRTSEADEEDDDEGGDKKKQQARTESRMTVRSTKKPAAGSFHAFQEADLSEVEPHQQPCLLIELARLCMDQYNYLDLAEICISELKNNSAMTKSDEVELELLDSVLILKQLGHKKESYKKDIVQLRVKLINRVDFATQHALRLDERDLVQASCTVLWNVMLPLLQPNLRHHCRRALGTIANALEEIDSLLVLLRCQVHTELAKCEEDVEQNQVAIQHIRKAMSFDDEGIYLERHEHALKCLEMRTTLYETPEDPLMLAMQVIEQAQSTGSSSTTMKRAHLMKAANALSPDAFHLVIESEDFDKVVAAASGKKGMYTATAPLGEKAKHYLQYVEKTEGHLKRLGNQQDRLSCFRVRLWADLAKVARRQKVWDVCRAACQFCLLYDDGRWSPPKSKTDLPAKASIASENPQSNKEERSSLVDEVVESRVVSEEKILEEDTHSQGSHPLMKSFSLYDKDLLINLAQIHFLYGEALIQMLRSEGVQLNDCKSYPEDKSKRPKGYVPPKQSEDENWARYCDWIKQLAKQATDAFLRGAEIGCYVSESWLVSCGAAYVWNYNTHILTNNRHREIIETLEKILNMLKETRVSEDTVMFVQLSNALSIGLISAYKPPDSPRLFTGEYKKDDKNSAKKPAENPKIVIDATGLDEIKKAIQVCEFAMNITNGSNPREIVPILVRQSLLATWVLAKQIAQQQIGKSLGFDETIFTMVESTTWTDPGTEIQSWVRLASLSYDSKNFELAMSAAEKALEMQNSAYMEKLKSKDIFKWKVFNQMLYYASCIMGQSLKHKIQGKNSLRRQCLSFFEDACRYGKAAGNYELVMISSRHFWNVALPSVSSKFERELLKSPIKNILRYIEDTVGKADSKQELKTPEPAAVVEAKKSLAANALLINTSSNAQAIGDPAEDLTIRAALYGVLFIAYVDKNDYKEALAAMDQAIATMPRTKHRLLIFRHRVMVKAKMGYSVAADIAKFKDESEDYVAHMWRRVALSSKEELEQLISYQHAIQALESPMFDWQKIDYLLEFGEWLYTNEYPINDVIDILDWAANILFNMRFHLPKPKQGSLKKKKQVKSRKSSLNSVRSDKADESSDIVMKTAIEDNVQTDDDESDMEFAPSTFVPMMREAEIGCALVNLSLYVSSFVSIRQLDCLIRVHVIEAKVTGTASDRYEQCCMLAYAFVHQLWQISLEYVGRCLRDGQFKDNKDSKANSSAKKRKEDKRKSEAKGKEFTSKKTVSIPQTFEEWATFDLADEIRTIAKEDTSGFICNTLTIAKPALTFNYLLELCDLLRGLLFSHLSLPVLALAEYIATDIIHNSSLYKIVKLKFAEVCTELSMISAAHFHENHIRNVCIDPTEQAEVRGNQKIVEEKMRQVRKAENNSKDSKKVMIANSAMSVVTKDILKSRLDSESKKKARTHEFGAALNHDGRNVGEANPWYYWTVLAALTMKLGRYQISREFIAEGFSAAKAVGDQSSVAKALILSAELAMLEGNWSTALEIVTQLQKDSAEIDTWIKAIFVVVDSIFASRSIKNYSTKCLDILEQCGQELEVIRLQQPNKQAEISVYSAKLTEKYADVIVKDITGLNTDSDTINCPVDLIDFAIDEKYQTINTMRPENHKSLLTAIKKYRECASILLLNKDILSYTKSLTYNSPIVSLDAEVRLLYCEVLLLIFESHVLIKCKQSQADRRRPSIEQVIDEFVASTPRILQDSPTDIEAVVSIIPQRVSTYTQRILMHSARSEFKSKALYLISKLTYMNALLKRPEDDCEWMIHQMNININIRDSLPEKGEKQLKRDNTRASNLAIAEVADDSKSNNDDAEEEQPEENQRDPMLDVINIRRSQRMALNMKLQNSFNKQLMVATEQLAQSAHLAFESSDKVLLSQCALEMVNMVGQFDPTTSFQYLALYQSCLAAIATTKMLNDVCINASSSLLNSLIRQLRCSNSRPLINKSSTMYKNILAGLDRFEAWRKTKISSHHFEIFKEISPNIATVILQHSPCRQFLYLGVMEKVRTSISTKAKQPQSNLSGEPSCNIYKVSINYARLTKLLDHIKLFKRKMAQTLLKNKSGQPRQNSNIVDSVDDDATPAQEEPYVEEVNEEFQKEFELIIEEMNSYLSPITSLISSALRSSPNVSSSDKLHVQSPANGVDSILLLPDMALHSLPLEAWSLLRTESNIKGMARDFSLQFAFYRLQKDSNEDVQTDDKKTDPKNVKGSARKQSKSTNVKESKRPVVKSSPLDREIPPGHLSADVHSLSYIVDPLDEAVGDFSPTTVFQKLLEEPDYQNKYSVRWIGYMGQQHQPTIGEWHETMRDCSILMYYGLENLLTIVDIDHLLPLNLSDCTLFLGLDRAQTHASYSRTSRIKVFKDVSHLSVEEPVKLAFILSLTGLIERGLTTGQTVKELAYPNSILWVPPTSATVKDKKGSSRRTSVIPQQSGDERPKPDIPTKTDLPNFNMALFGLPSIIIS